jgi:TRAP transporter TAXI family solute receptor
VQLLSPRLRILLIIVIWIVSIGALVLWWGGGRDIRITIGGGPAYSETLQLTTAIADAINESGRGFRLEVFETGGSRENLRLLESGRIDLATLQADTPASDRVLGVVTLYQDAYHLIANEETGIESFADLPGHRIAIPPATSGQNGSFWFLARHYGLSRSDVNALPMDESAANFAMEQGQVDSVFRVRAAGNNAIRELIGDKSLDLIPIDQSSALSLKNPAIESGVIPLGSYRGNPALPKADLATAVVERLLVARSDLDQHIIYRISQAIFETRSDILEDSRLAGFIGPLPDESSSVIAAHPGARAYFDREKPGFMQQNARLVSAVLYIVAIVFSGLLALRTHWVRSRRLRMHTFNRRLMEIAAGARDEMDAGKLMASKHHLMDMLREVVDDLEGERVNQEEFEHFSFTWQAVDALLRDRLHMATDGREPQVAGGARS